MGTLKLNSIIRKTHFTEQEGYSVTQILALMIMLRLMLLKSVNSFYQSEFQKVNDDEKGRHLSPQKPRDDAVARYFVRSRQAVPNAHQSRKGRGGHVGIHH